MDATIKQEGIDEDYKEIVLEPEVLGNIKEEINCDIKTEDSVDDPIYIDSTISSNILENSSMDIKNEPPDDDIREYSVEDYRADSVGDLGSQVEGNAMEVVYLMENIKPEQFRNEEEILPGYEFFDKTTKTKEKQRFIMSKTPGSINQLSYIKICGAESLSTSDKILKDFREKQLLLVEKCKTRLNKNVEEFSNRKRIRKRELNKRSRDLDLMQKHSCNELEFKQLEEGAITASKEIISLNNSKEKNVDKSKNNSIKRLKSFRLQSITNSLETTMNANTEMHDINSFLNVELIEEPLG